MRNGTAIVKLALDRANDSENNGNGYSVRIRTTSGVWWEGAVISFNYQTTSSCRVPALYLQVWEQGKTASGMPMEGPATVPTDREVFIDPDTVESIEIIW